MEPFRRRDARLSVRTRSVVEHDGQVQTGWTRNISLSGVFIRNLKPVPQGTAVSLKIGGLHFEAQAVREERQGQAFLFLDPGEDRRRQLANMLIFYAQRKLERFTDTEPVDAHDDPLLSRLLNEEENSAEEVPLTRSEKWVAQGF